MTQPFEITITPDGNFDQIVLNLSQSDEKTKQAIHDALFAAGTYVLDQVKGSPNMPRKTGTLSRSIVLNIIDGDTESSAEIGSNLPYAYIHEYGGTYTFHRSSAWGRQTRPFSYEATYKERAYLRRPFAEATDEIERIFDQRLAEVFR